MHAACRAGDYFIDASVHRFKEAADIDAPNAVLVQRLGRPSHFLGRYIVTDMDRL